MPRISSSCRNDRFGGGGDFFGQLDNVDGSTNARKKTSQVLVGMYGLFAIRITSARAVPPHQIRARPCKSPCKSSPVNLQPEKLIRDISGWTVRKECNFERKKKRREILEHKNHYVWSYSLFGWIRWICFFIIICLFVLTIHGPCIPDCFTETAQIGQFEVNFSEGHIVQEGSSQSGSKGAQVFRIKSFNPR